MFSRKAQVVDVLRSMQRDDLAIKILEENIQGLSKSLGARNYQALHRYISFVSSLLYYYATSGNNLQTLGEEYSNIIRLNNNVIPSKMTQIIWLTLYIGGKPMLDRLSLNIETKIRTSGELREEARQSILNIFKIWHACKDDFLMIHKAFFYMNAHYYSFAHRILDINYIIVRDWLEEKSFNRSFRILGIVTLSYSLVNIINKLWNLKLNKTKEMEETVPKEKSSYSIKICALCNEERKNPSSTPCGHIFCWDCIYESLSYSQKCPLCREEVLPSRIVFLQNFV
ncbi:peroxisome biogenesis factor 10-like [Harmonia axyridis]|uniref:peroxisome biogenesis factor 10-like n=1 Tax=Harmonia axyridis TaxID=115357 RepID=UPI001E278001|nr:peroxisome biogenesis factor 10-like [Harmonia axyridis]